MHDDVGAVLERPHEVGRGQRVVDDERDAGLLGHGRDRRNVGDDAARIGDRFDEDRFRLLGDQRLETARVGGIGPFHLPTEPLERVVELVDGAAVELGRCDELVAGFHQRVEHDLLGGMAGSNRQSRGPALQGGHPLFQHRAGRVGDAGIDVSEGLQAEERRGMIDILEHEGGRLVDRRDAGARRRIGLRARVNRQGGETGDVLVEGIAGHDGMSGNGLTRAIKHGC